ncbi:MAG: hypothetical protein JNJ88_12630 [Planctomycetes bacterium]|nr:hypothetical protein [Planctomycetota bacterium]
MSADDQNAVCNIDRRGSRQRLAMGIVAAATTLGAGAWVILTHPPGAARVAVGAPAFVAALCLLQARAKT